MKKPHIPRNWNEIIHSPVTLVTGTAFITAAVLLSYNYMMNADGEVLLDVAVDNLISMVQLVIG